MANILLTEDFALKQTHFDANKTVILSEIFFYIPNKFTDSRVYIMLIDSLGITDIISLQFFKNHNEYKVYKINATSTIRVKSGDLKVQVLVVESGSNAIKTSTFISLSDVSIDNYKMIRQLQLINDFSADISDTYKKISELTKINVEIYEKIQTLMSANKGEFLK